MTVRNLQYLDTHPVVEWFMLMLASMNACAPLVRHQDSHTDHASIKAKMHVNEDEAKYRLAFHTTELGGCAKFRQVVFSLELEGRHPDYFNFDIELSQGASRSDPAMVKRQEPYTISTGATTPEELVKTMTALTYGFLDSGNFELFTAFDEQFLRTVS